MVSIEKMTLREMILDKRNHSLSDGLSELPLPEKIKIGFRKYKIPKTLDEYSDAICYGQKLYLTEKEENDFGIILRFITGYYYPLFSNKPFNSDSAMSFGRVIKWLHVVDLYPVAIHLVKLHAELIEREQKALHREPSAQEKEAGIEKLSIFAELTALDYLREALKKTESEVMLTPYNECLVRFMLAKEQSAFNERYMEVMRKESERKSKVK